MFVSSDVQPTMSQFASSEDFAADRRARRQKLSGRLAVVRDMLLVGSHTPASIAAAINTGTAAATARIRDLRKPQYGSYNVSVHQAGKNTFYYSIVE